MPGRTVVLVRHGATEWSLTGQHTGRTDVPLLPEGEAQGRWLARLLAEWEFALVLSSPRQRALETCRLSGLGDVVEVTEDLAEWDYGECEGRTTPEIRAECPGWDLWVDGVVGGETVADVGRRADALIDRLRAAEGDSVCFAHGHLLRILAARWVGLPPVGGRTLALGPGSLSELGWERETPVIVRWNEVAQPG